MFSLQDINKWLHQEGTIRLKNTKKLKQLSVLLSAALYTLINFYIVLEQAALNLSISCIRRVQYPILCECTQTLMKKTWLKKVENHHPDIHLLCWFCQAS